MDGRNFPRNRGNANKIARLRIAAGLTQAQLAEKTGTKMRTIQYWESGAAPSGKYLTALASALGCKIDDLF